MICISAIAVYAVAKCLSLSHDLVFVSESGLAGFCQKAEITGYCHGKNGVAKIGFCQNIFFIIVKCCYTVYNVLTDDWHTDNDSTAVKNQTLIMEL